MLEGRSADLSEIQGMSSMYSSTQSDPCRTFTSENMSLWRSALKLTDVSLLLQGGFVSRVTSVSVAISYRFSFVMSLAFNIAKPKS